MTRAGTSLKVAVDMKETWGEETWNNRAEATKDAEMSLHPRPRSLFSSRSQQHAGPHEPSAAVAHCSLEAAVARLNVGKVTLRAMFEMSRIGDPLEVCYVDGHLSAMRPFVCGLTWPWCSVGEGEEKQDKKKYSTVIKPTRVG